MAKFEAIEQVDDELSATLSNNNYQDLAAAMELYRGRTAGFYDGIVKPFEMDCSEALTTEDVTSRMDELSVATK